MGRNSILEQLRQQSIERMRQERVNRLHHERKDRPILLEAERKNALGQVIPPTPSAAGAASSSAGGGSDAPVVPPIQTKFAFEVKGDTPLNEEGEDNKISWEVSAAEPVEGATIAVTTTRAGESTKTTPEIPNLHFSWDGLGIPTPDEAETIFYIGANQTGVLAAAGYHGEESNLQMNMENIAGQATHLTSWNFGTIFNSLQYISVNGFKIMNDMALDGINHLTGLKSFEVDNWGTVFPEIGLDVSIDGKDHPILSVITIGSEALGGDARNIELKGITSWRDADPFPINAQVQIAGLNISGSLKFSSWNTKGTYDPAMHEPGTLSITDTEFIDEATIDLSGLAQAYISFNWVVKGEMLSLPTLNLPQLRKAYTVSISDHNDLETLNPGSTTYSNLTTLTVSGCSGLSSISSWANVIAPYFQTFNLSSCGALTSEEIANVMGTMYTAYANSENIPSGGNLILTEIEPDTTATIYQLYRQFFCDPLHMNWAIEGDGWNVLQWEFSPAMSDPQSTLAEACTAGFGSTSYYQTSGTEFDPAESTFLDPAGVEPLSSDPDTHVFVRDTLADQVYEYYPDGLAPGSNPSLNIYRFWEAVVCP